MLGVDTSYKFPSDLKIIERREKFMNGSNGIQPTIELATTNGNNGFAYPYPVYPMMNGGYGNNGFFGGDGIWIILLFALLFSNGNWGGNGGFFGGNSFDNGYAWLSNGQKEIMNNTNNGFDTLHLSNQIENVHDGIWSLSNAICNSTSDIVGAVNNGFANAETSENARQIANMNQAFNSQIATLQGFNNLGSRLDDCCCENRLASCQTQNTIISEAANTRFANANNTRDIIENANRNNQAVLDKLCQLELDGFKRENDQLRSQLQFANMQASQVAQTAELRANNATVANQLVAELRSCPIPAQPVYGNQPIFTCPANYNGCGCNGNFTTSQFI